MMQFVNLNSDVKIKDIIDYLNEHIIGQDRAKKDIAVAIKRKFMMNKIEDEEWRNEISPTNILLIGDTGVGKTEIMRRIAKFIKVPFVKVDITEFSQTGYVGRDVREIITEDLFAVTKDFIKKEYRDEIIDDEFIEEIAKVIAQHERPQNTAVLATNPFMLTLDEFESSIDNIEDIKKRIKEKDPSIMNKYVEVMIVTYKKTPFGKLPIQQMLSGTVKKVIEQYIDIAVENALTDKIRNLIKELMENSIVFIDEIDKIAGQNIHNVSTVGVQRGLLSLLEDKNILLDNGVSINTKKILFVAAGAFKVSKPEDLLPELLGRLTYRVYLRPFTKDELKQILIRPKYSVIKKIQKLYEVNGIELIFEDDAIEYLAEKAHELNQKENLGARRVIQLTEQLTSELDYDLEIGNVELQDDNKLIVTREYLEKKFAELQEASKNTHYIRKLGF
jgi:ATP-dependent HslUV protease ATP-binding subunit HslU